jgi:hypothetical protein
LEYFMAICVKKHLATLQPERPACRRWRASRRTIEGDQPEINSEDNTHVAVGLGLILYFYFLLA